MLGLDEVLGKGKNLTSDEVKEYAMKGLPVGYSILPDGAGGWRLASVQETNQISQEQNPGAFIAGNILGSIPTTIATGGTVSAGAKALGAGAKVARALGSGTVNAVRGFSDSMSRGGQRGAGDIEHAGQWADRRRCGRLRFSVVGRYGSWQAEGNAGHSEKRGKPCGGFGGGMPVQILQEGR